MRRLTIKYFHILSNSLDILFNGISGKKFIYDIFTDIHQMIANRYFYIVVTFDYISVKMSLKQFIKGPST